MNNTAAPPGIRPTGLHDVVLPLPVIPNHTSSFFWTFPWCSDRFSWFYDMTLNFKMPEFQETTLFVDKWQPIIPSSGIWNAWPKFWLEVVTISLSLDFLLANLRCNTKGGNRIKQTMNQPWICNETPHLPAQNAKVHPSTQWLSSAEISHTTPAPPWRVLFL